MKLSEVICQTMEMHIKENDGLIMGETLTSIGNTYGTIPSGECANIIELPMTDVAAGGFVTGAALTGRRTVFVLRFQDFFMLNCSSLLQDAAISKEFHGYGCPIFIRGIFSEKAGPNHSNSLHSIPMHFPGIQVCAPMTGEEYREVYDIFMSNDIPMYVSEDRRALSMNFESHDTRNESADITLYAVGDSRLEIDAVAGRLRNDGYSVNVAHIYMLKPFNAEFYAEFMADSTLGLVVDTDRQICGASEHIAYSLMTKTGRMVYALGSDDYVKCLSVNDYHEAPKYEEIYLYAISLMRRHGK